MTKPRSVAKSRLVGSAALGATSGLPVAGDDTPPCPSDTIKQCAAWIALDLEVDRLTLRWAKLEAEMARDHGWLNLEASARRALPEAAEMFEIDDALDALSDQREAMLARLVRLSAASLHDIASMLAVAARLVRHEDIRALPLLETVLTRLAGLKCPECGTPCLPDAVEQQT